jgi:hypothetical protein
MWMRVRLIRKLAERIDGIDLRTYEPGDTLEVTRSDARLLIAEGWAARETPRRYRSGVPQQTAVAAHRPKRTK